MIGNDIIDLKIARAEKKARNHRFIDKVFHPHEKELIMADEDPDLKLWILWSMKEAAYKSHQRLFSHPRRLNPKSFNCRLEKDVCEVSVSKKVYSVKMTLASDYIHSYCGDMELFKKIYANCSSNRKSFLSDYSRNEGIEEEEIGFSKDILGIPNIVLRKSQKMIPVSMSHHGDFTGFIIPLINS